MKWALGWFGILVLASCSSQKTDGGEGGQGGGGGSAGGGDFGGGLQVDEPGSRIDVEGGPSWVVLSATFRDIPNHDFHQEAERSGDCRLLTYEPAFCEPECTSEQECVNGTCEPMPILRDAGTLTFAGLLDAGVDISSETPGMYSWQKEEPEIPWGSVVQVSSSGAEVGAFDLSVESVVAIEPATAGSDWSQALEERSAGESATLEWSNPQKGARVYLRMTTGIGTHGGISPVEIECEGPDRGSLTLPGSYLDALNDAPGAWSCGECGTHDLLRYRSLTTTAGPDSIELRVGLPTSFSFRPGGGLVQ